MGRSYSPDRYLLFIAHAFWNLKCVWKHKPLSAHTQVCHTALYYLLTDLHKESWVEDSFNCCKLTRYRVCSIQQQEQKTSSKSCCLETSRDDFRSLNKSWSMTATDLLCLRKLDPSDLVAAIKARHLLLTTGCIRMACCTLYVIHAVWPLIERAPSRHSAGVLPEFCRNETMRKSELL